MLDAATFQRVADRITRGLIEPDFTAYQSAFTLPLRIEPRDARPTVMDTVDQLEADFWLYQKTAALHQITDIYRHVLEIQPQGEDAAAVHAETTIMRNAERVVGPVRSRFDMVLIRGDWRICTVHSSVGHINWTVTGSTQRRAVDYSDLDKE